MRYYPLLGVAPESFGLLADMSMNMEILIGKTKDGVKGFVALDCARPDTMFSAAKMKVDVPVAIHLAQGVLIVRKVERIPGIPTATDDGSGNRILRLLTNPPNFGNLSRLMREGDYARFILLPIRRPLGLHHGFTLETNAAFQARPCFTCIMEVSSSYIAEAMMADLITTGGDFRIVQGGYDVKAEKRISSGRVFMDKELHFLLDGVGHLCAEMFPETIYSSMVPSQVLNRPEPDVVIGKNCGIPVGFQLRDLLTNLAVVGLTGSGKTTIERRIIRALLKRNIPVVVISPLKHDYSEAFQDVCDLYRAGDDEHPLRFNVLDIPHTPQAMSIASAALTQIIPVSADSWLPMVYETTLSGLFSASGDAPVGLSDLAAAARTEFDLSGYRTNREGNSMKQALLNRPKFAYQKPEFNCASSNIDFARMMEPGRLTVIELHDMEAANRRAFAAVFLQRLIWAYRTRMQSSCHGLRFTLVFDELHELLYECAGIDPFRDALNSSLNTARGMGVGHILCDQRLDLLGEIATHGCASHIVLSHPATEQAAKMLCLPPDSEYMDMLPFYAPGEGLLHVTHHKTIPFDGKIQEDTTLPNADGKTPIAEKPYLPYPVCAQACKNCDFRVHRAAYEGVAGQLSGAVGVYREYVKAVNEAKSIDDRQERDNAMYMAKSKLLSACVRAAVKKAEDAGLSTRENLRVIQYCVKYELNRQMSFRV